MHPERPRKQGFPHMAGGCAGLSKLAIFGGIIFEKIKILKKCFLKKKNPDQNF
jgi:hypothetical protein